MRDKENVASLSEERIAYLEELVSQARTAAAVFTQYTQEDVDRIVKPMVLAGLEQAQYFARLAIDETRLGGCRRQGPEEHGGDKPSHATAKRIGRALLERVSGAKPSECRQVISTTNR